MQTNAQYGVDEQAMLRKCASVKSFARCIIYWLLKNNGGRLLAVSQ